MRPLINKIPAQGWVHDTQEIIILSDLFYCSLLKWVTPDPIVFSIILGYTPLSYIRLGTANKLGSYTSYVLEYSADVKWLRNF